MKLQRRALLAAPWLALLGPVHAATLPAPRSLIDELAAALQARRPLVVMASLHGCPYCRTVRDGYLAPLRAETRQPVVQLDMHRKDEVEGFDGTMTTHDALLRSWRIRVAPTVLFFGRDGREVAPRLVGAPPDFYAAYLQQRMETALRSL